MSSKKGKRIVWLSRELILLLLITIFMSLGMNLTNSLWPLYIRSLGATVLQVSFVISITSAAGTFFRVPSGLISDNYGRKKIIIISILLGSKPSSFKMSTTSDLVALFWLISNQYFPSFLRFRVSIMMSFSNL